MASPTITPPLAEISPSSKSSPIDIPQLPSSHADLSPEQQSALFTETYTTRLKAVEDIIAATTNPRAARRVSNFLEVANEAIQSISKLKFLIIDANNPKKPSGRKEEDAIDLAYLFAVTELNKTYVIMGSGGVWHGTAPGIASQELAGGVARYLDYVKREHKPVHYLSDDDGDDDDEDEDYEDNDDDDDDEDDEDRDGDDDTEKVEVVLEIEELSEPEGLERLKIQDA